jgi:hypothetical protein
MLFFSFDKEVVSCFAVCCYIKRAGHDKLSRTFHNSAYND